jgi:hypothetical protein
VKYLDGFEAGHVRHEDVDDREIECVGFDRVRTLMPALGEHDDMAFALENGFCNEADQNVVIDDEDACHGILLASARQSQAILRRPQATLMQATPMRATPTDVMDRPNR